MWARLAIFLVCVLWTPGAAGPAPRPETSAGSVSAASIAVVIGNRNHRDASFPPVAWADRDAAAVRDAAVRVLGYAPENILVLSDATLADFNKIFGTRECPGGKLRRWLTPGRSDVLIYYSGHGAQPAHGKGAFLVPSDADLDFLEASAYPLERLWENLAALPVRSLTVVLDACFSGSTPGGGLVRNASPAVLRRTAPWSAPEGAVLMAAAAEEQLSSWYPEKKHGLFTYLWLQGIAGSADGDANGVVTVGEMKAFLGEFVPQFARRLYGREQNPVILGDEGKILARVPAGTRRREAVSARSLPPLGRSEKSEAPSPEPPPPRSEPRADAGNEAYAATSDVRAAERGDAEAQFLLGMAYSEGRGVPQDGEAAVRWYARAAEQGHPRAQNNLGVAYDHGRGVPQDYVRAYLWFNLAAARLSGPEGQQAARNRTLVSRKMTSDQIAEAQRLVRVWTENHKK